jgi:hypothetical protein
LRAPTRGFDDKRRFFVVQVNIVVVRVVRVVGVSGGSRDSSDRREWLVGSVSAAVER